MLMVVKEMIVEVARCQGACEDGCQGAVVVGGSTVDGPMETWRLSSEWMCAMLIYVKTNLK